MHVNELHPALKWVHGKGQSVIAGKLFSSIGQCLAQRDPLWDSEKNYLNCFYEALVQEESFTIYQDRVFASFLCALSLPSILGWFINLYWAIPEKNKQEGWGYGTSKVAEEMISEFSGG